MFNGGFQHQQVALKQSTNTENKHPEFTLNSNVWTTMFPRGIPVAWTINEPHLLYTIVSNTSRLSWGKLKANSHQESKPLGLSHQWLYHWATITSYHPNISLYVLHRWYWRLQLLFIFSTWHLGFQLWQGVSAALDVMHTVTHCTWGTAIQVFLYCLVLPCIVRMLDVRQIPWMWGRFHGCEADAIYVHTQLPSHFVYVCMW